MKYLFSFARIFLGLIFIIFGLNGFFLFIPVPEFHPFMQIMVDSGFIYVEKTLEVFAGILLLTKRFQLLALLILGPLIGVIILYHFMMDLRNWPIAIVNLILYGILVYRHGKFIRFILKPNYQESDLQI